MRCSVLRRATHDEHDRCRELVIFNPFDAWAFGSANGVNDLEALTYANLICNEGGMDPISFWCHGCAVMELYETGVLTKEQLCIEAPLGSVPALLILPKSPQAMRDLARRSGSA